ncbi:head GIN domain-containing protein [Hyphobacterium sp. HN65]|uniref:Head GIN domain-containing protein n=1 Tax=Hyphobacterium lacteum TaxID=3116575 RepID=A0ABU7LLW3_9PROT|nr:head GIN domain-containing protein [Hyphobacterium sp. HN65]MEE2524917.1 head GIN domain-containing protein [Hyphobacterium sp. HN65]
MKNWLFGGIATLVLAGTAAAQSDDRNINIGNFERLDAGGRFEIVFTPGDRPGLRFEGDADDIDDIEYELNGGELEIRQNRRFFRWFGGDRRLDVTIHVTGPGVGSFHFSRGVDARLDGIDSEELNLSASTGADVDAGGNCSYVDLNASTGAELDGRDLSCANVDVNASTGASVTVNATESLDANVSTGADVRSLSRPANISINTSTGGDVHMGSSH